MLFIVVVVRTTLVSPIPSVVYLSFLCPKEEKNVYLYCPAVLPTDN